MIIAFVVLLTVLFLSGIGMWAQNLEGQRKMQLKRISRENKGFLR
jgi:cytochrome b subunit of formate dehydrogenase